MSNPTTAPAGWHKKRRRWSGEADVPLGSTVEGDSGRSASNDVGAAASDREPDQPDPSALGDRHLAPSAVDAPDREVTDTEPFMDPSLWPSGPTEVGGGFPPVLERPVKVEECLLDNGRPLAQPGPLAGLGPETFLVVDGDRRHLAAPEATLFESKVACVSSIGAMTNEDHSDFSLGYSRSRRLTLQMLTLQMLTLKQYHVGVSLGNGILTR